MCDSGVDAAVRGVRPARQPPRPLLRTDQNAETFSPNAFVPTRRDPINALPLCFKQVPFWKRFLRRFFEPFRWVGMNTIL